MSFEYRRPDTLDPEALADPGVVLYAGGTDLLPLTKLGLVRPQVVVDVKGTSIPGAIERTEDGWRLGGLATLAAIEDHDGLRADLAVIDQAVAQAATRQIRNRATVGGNLLQRPRCRYYRDEAMSCWFSGGDSCPAREGRNEHHGIFDTGGCVAVQPSDLASALVALDAHVAIVGRADRTVAVADLLAPPTDDRRSLNRLEPGEVVDSVLVPAGDGRRSCYLKAMDRAAWQFALVGLAAVVDTADDGTVRDARLVASGVATVPWTLDSTRDSLIGRPLDAETIAEAAGHADDGARALSENGYKRALLRGLARRALERLADT